MKSEKSIVAECGFLSRPLRYMIARAAVIKPAKLVENDAVGVNSSLLKKSLNLDQDYYDTNRLLGTFYYYKNNFSKAIIYLKKAYQLNPDHREGSLFLASAYLFNNQDDQYLSLLNQILSNTTHETQIIEFFAREMFRKGYYKNTILIIEESQDLLPKDSPLFELKNLSILKLKEVRSSRTMSAS